MIDINLLPHREAKRAADVRQSIALLVLGLVLAGGGIAIVHRDLNKALDQSRATVRQLEAAIEQFKPQEKQVAAFKKKRGQLEGKLNVITGLDRARSGPVRILDEISKNTPDRLWLVKLSTKGTNIKVEGVSLDTGVVADFLRSLNNSEYFVNVDLEKTRGGKEIDGVRLVDVIICAELRTSSVKKKG
ncbi:MAG: PilN domain-containing protein [Deltaproteobacteria bacterium]|nr:PilN domain-containing protein [Deltaproteobacteria bacterium]